MRELLFTILELEKWHSSNSTCVFCSGLKKAVCQIRARSKATGEMVESDKVCESCKEKFENDELPKCSCGRLKTRYTCDCKEEDNEKELPLLPNEEISQSAFYERQINSLQEEKTHLAVEAQSHLDAMEAFEVYNKKHRKELLDRIKELETEVESLKKQTPQELLDEISKLKERIKELEEQTAQIEVKETKRWPWKSKK